MKWNHPNRLRLIILASILTFLGFPLKGTVTLLLEEAPVPFVDQEI